MGKVNKSGLSLVSLGTRWGEQKALELLRDAGYADVAVREIEEDIFNNYYVARC